MKKVIAAALLFMTTAVFSAPDMTLKDAIKTALQNQENVLRGEQSLQAAKYRLTESKSDYFPQVSVDYTQGIFNSTSSRATGSSTISTSMNFYDGGLRENKIRSARYSVDSSANNLERSKQTVINDVTRAYFTLLRTKKQNEVVKSQLKFLTSQLELIKARVEVGEAAAVEVLPVEAKAANARVDLLSSNNSIRSAAMQLQDAMGISLTVDFNVADYELNGFAIDPLDNYIAAAKLNRPEVLESKAAVESAKVNLEISKLQSRLRPQVSGTWKEPLIGNGKSDYSVSAGVVFSIFDGGANKAAINASNTSLESAMIHQKQLDKDIITDVQLAYINVQNSMERMAASELSLKAAKASYDAQEERYKLGLATPLDLLNAQNEVVSAQYNAVQAKYDYYTYIGQLEYATGKQGVLYGN